MYARAWCMHESSLGLVAYKAIKELRHVRAPTCHVTQGAFRLLLSGRYETNGPKHGHNHIPYVARQMTKRLCSSSGL